MVDPPAPVGAAGGADRSAGVVAIVAVWAADNPLFPSHEVGGSGGKRANCKTGPDHGSAGGIVGNLCAAIALLSLPYLWRRTLISNGPQVVSGSPCPHRDLTPDAGSRRSGLRGPLRMHKRIGGHKLEILSSYAAPSQIYEILDQ